MLRGVIDSPDIPLNVSRSYLQADGAVKKISSYITRKVADKLKSLFTSNREDFEKQWNDIKIVIEYGMLSEEKFFEKSGDFALYPTVDGTYDGVDYEEIVPAYVPPIHDFTMEQDGEDYAPELLQEPKLVMVVMYSLAKSEADGMAKLKDLVAKATSKGYKIIGVTASNVEDQNQAMSQFGYDLDFYFCDQTALKTIVRSNPGVLVLNKGTITQKVHWNDIEDLKL